MSVNTSIAQVTPATGGGLTRWKRAGLRWLVLVVILVIWQIATGIMDSPYFPQPSEIFERAWELWAPGADAIITTSMSRDVIPSLTRTLIGFGIAVVAGITLGTVIGLNRSIEAYLDWILQFMRAVPPPTLFPVFLIVFGTGNEMRVALIAFGTVWPILLNTIEGVRGVKPLTLEAARVFRIESGDRLFRVMLPSAGPKILAGIRTSLSLSLILMVISEMLASSSGIGYQLVQAQRSFAILNMWAAILLLAVLGYLLNLILTVVERRILAWQRLSGRETS